MLLSYYIDLIESRLERLKNVQRREAFQREYDEAFNDKCDNKTLIRRLRALNERVCQELDIEEE